MEALTPEVAHFGIKTMTVEPGFFRTDLLTPESTTFADSAVADYADAREEIISEWSRMNGRQSGDPAKLASALVTLVASGEPPLRFPAGEDALETFVSKADRLMSEAEAHGGLSSSLAH